MSWSKLCLVWVLLWVGPQLAGDWYDTRYGVYQALTSVTLLVCVHLMPTRSQWQYLSMMAILCIQIVIDVLWQASWDYPEAMKSTFLYVSSEFYESAALGILNSLEAILLFIVGGIRTAIHECITDANDTADSSADHS